MLVAGVCVVAIACGEVTITPDSIHPVAVTISSGELHTCALLIDGSAVCWGANDHGQAPSRLNAAPGFKAITSGEKHSCGLQNRSWFCWGNYYGPFRERVGAGSPRPYEVEPPSRGEAFDAISSGRKHVCALRPSGEAACWGWNESGQASPFEDERFTAVSSGEEHTCALRPDGSPVCWSDRNWAWSEEEMKLVQCPPIDRPQGEQCEHHSIEAIKESIVRSWRGVYVGSLYAGIPPRDLRLAAISSGSHHTCALRLDGSPVCWGFIETGEPFEDQIFRVVSSGNSHTCLPMVDFDSLYPGVCRGFETLADERFAAISSGSGHTCALRLDGTPVCWGFNQEGQASPPEGERFVAVSSGGYHTCALRPDGSAVCWGNDARGQSSPPDMRFSVAHGGTR